MCFPPTSPSLQVSFSLAFGCGFCDTTLGRASSQLQGQIYYRDIPFLEQRGFLSSFSHLPKANPLWPFLADRNQNEHPPGMFLTRIYLQAPAHTSQRLARFLDRPLFPWKNLIVGFSLAQYLFEGFLSLRQYQVLKQTRPPKVLQNEVSQEVFDKSQVCKANRILTITCVLTCNSPMDERRRSSPWPAVSTVKFKTLHSSTSTFSQNFGP